MWGFSFVIRLTHIVNIHFKRSKRAFETVISNLLLNLAVFLYLELIKNITEEESECDTDIRFRAGTKEL